MSRSRPYYVAGFLIAPEADEVVLVRKNRPAWQAGKLNAVGGKIEPGESPYEAMRREFREEASLDLDGWEEFLTLDWEGGLVHFFRLFAPLDVLVRVVPMTDEVVSRFNIHGLLVRGAPTIPNLRWLLPLAAYQHDTYAPIEVDEIPTEVRV